MENLYADIARRTGGNIYIGVVGPVRTGKSTLIKRVMEQLVIPNISDPYRAQRARDELPQCGSGRTVMTSEPKFVPEEAVEITPGDGAALRIRMIDSVGYLIPGASGITEEGAPRMVTTPWFDREIPMSQAAELGTRRVMEDHCTVGVVVTTDGTVTDIPQEDYLEAEARAIEDMQATGKPFLVLVNTRAPDAPPALAARQRIRDRFDLEPALADCQSLTPEALGSLLKQLLETFPLDTLRVHLPRWMDVLEPDHPIKTRLYRMLLQLTGEAPSLNRLPERLQQLQTLEEGPRVETEPADLATGTLTCRIRFPETLFYQLLSQRTGLDLLDDGDLLETLTELSRMKEAFDRIAPALESVNATGYGIVMPAPGELELKDPELVKKGGVCGIRLMARSPSIHMLRVDVDAQISPTVGDEQRTRELVAQLCAQEPQALLESNLFGRSVGELLQEGLTGKLLNTPPEVRDKYRATLCRIVNEGANGLLCILL